MRTKRRRYGGFTIVELLIVVVVIAILAAVTVVAYTGIQVRARDTMRTQSVRQIQHALEVYRAEHGVYPETISIDSNIPQECSATDLRYGSSYSYSIDTAGNWLKNLTTSPQPGKPHGHASSLPVDPLNSCTYKFIYWASGGNSYGACLEPFYVLLVDYEVAQNIPDDSRDVICTGNGQTAGWYSAPAAINPKQGVFSNIRTPET